MYVCIRMDCMDVQRISVVDGLGVLAACSSLGRPAAEGCGPYTIPCSVLGWMTGGWLAGFLAFPLSGLG